MTPETFYAIKGFIALTGTILIVVHMNKSWNDLDRDEDGVRTGVSQRMRYISWFMFVVLVAAASKEQIDDGIDISRRNVGAMFVVSFAVLTAIVSIIEAARNVQRRH